MSLGYRRLDVELRAVQRDVLQEEATKSFTDPRAAAIFMDIVSCWETFLQETYEEKKLAAIGFSCPFDTTKSCNLEGCKWKITNQSGVFHVRPFKCCWVLDILIEFIYEAGRMKPVWRHDEVFEKHILRLLVWPRQTGYTIQGRLATVAACLVTSAHCLRFLFLSEVS